MTNQNPLIRPPAVQKGDLVAVIAPSGAIGQERVTMCVDLLERMGLRAKVANNVYDRRGYLAGQSDAATAKALTDAFADTDVRAIICARGGYGVMRILEYIDWSVLAANPKFFCGYSDMTALLLAIQQQCHMVTFHGGALPVPEDATARQWNEESMMRAMTQVATKGEIQLPAHGPTVDTIVAGTTQGLLTGGNLSLLAALCGTKWQPQFAGKIVLIEDVNESPYRIDRMLTQLLLSSVFNGVQGIIFGDSPTCDVEPAAERLTLKEVILDRLAPLAIPLIYGFPCGHTDYRATLPFGMPVILNATSRSVTIV